MPNDFDAIVIGSGAGGGTIAWKLAAAGRRVLLIERGRRPDRNAPRDESRSMIAMEDFDDRSFTVNEREARLFIGGVLGGGTSLFGGVMMRPSREDFHPGRYYADLLPRHLWEWPIDYDALAPYYDEVERLFGVCGDSAMLHVEAPASGYERGTPDLEPINFRLKEGIKRAGYRPFHLPLAIDFARCLRCAPCPGYLCPNDSRASTLTRLIDGAVQDHGLTVRTDAEALEILFDSRGEARGIRVKDRTNGTDTIVTAETYVLSAGAIGSAAILLRSGYDDRSNQLGANYMYHCGALAAGLFAGPTGGAERFVKQLGFTDLYFGTSEYRHKLGYVQTLPTPGPLMLIGSAPVRLPHRVARAMSRRMLVISGAVEDLPVQSNRVEIDRNGRIVLRHRFHPYDVERSRWYLRRLKRVMRYAGARVVLGATGDRDEVHTAHQVGTARFGNDPNTSVLSGHCQLHGAENVYVVDGSFMPTSLGVPPALTIAANALRVGDHILRS